MKTRGLTPSVVGVLVLVATLLSSSTATASIFLNGVNIDGAVNQTIENCTVKIDDKGNVLIIAKGYEVRSTIAPPPKPTAPAPEPVTKQYFLVAQASTPALAQYDVDVFINHVWVKRVVSTESQLVLDVSKHLRKGNNTVHFTAKKNLGEGRKSEAAAHSLTLHLGEGAVANATVVIDRPLIEYVRTAAELQTFDDDFVIVAR
jgi:hypothetical protein